MIRGISIFRRIQCADKNKGCNGRPYGTLSSSSQPISSSSASAAIIILLTKMFCWLPPIYAVLAILLFYYVGSACSELEYFPGLRRPPPVANWAQSEDFLSQLIEEHARRRLQQQLAQQHFYHQMHQHQRGPNVQVEDFLEPSFTYKFSDNLGQSQDEETTFAVNPADPRYYDSNSDSGSSGSNGISSGSSSGSSTNNLNNKNNNNNVETLTSHNDDHLPRDSIKSNAETVENIVQTKDDVPYYKPKPPMNVNPKLSLDHTFPGHSDINALMDKLQRETQGNVGGQRNEVVKKHMEIDGAMGMYVVALIAGISAAVTVGLIALGIGWYTLHKKSKAAADVDYPAYGVTGPNKDISPSGDRRLAQSAQMYHYQHQKQQIIAMENRTAGEHHGSMSDVESDDDNEEGDYTVYECPGLAPTGEMEVKNPLFLDDTPLTPSINVGAEQQQPQQPQQQKQQPQQQPQQQQQQQQQQKQQHSNQPDQSLQKQSIKKQTKRSSSPSNPPSSGSASASASASASKQGKNAKGKNGK